MSDRQEFDGKKQELEAESTLGYLGLDATTGRQWTREDVNLARLMMIELAAEISPEPAGLSIGLQQLASQFLFDSIARLTENLNIS